MSETSDDPLEELVETAEKQRQEFNKARKRLQEVRVKLRDAIDTLESEGTIDETEAERIRSLVEDGQYGDAREAIKEARESEELEFTDEEKDQFARRFSDSYAELEAAVEDVRTSLLELGGDLDREDMVAYLYGKHSALNKRDIRRVFDAFDAVERTGLDNRQVARVLAAYESDLKINPTVEVLEAIEETAE